MTDEQTLLPIIIRLHHVDDLPALEERIRAGDRIAKAQVMAVGKVLERQIASPSSCILCDQLPRDLNDCAAFTWFAVQVGDTVATIGKPICAACFGDKADREKLNPRLAEAWTNVPILLPDGKIRQITSTQALPVLTDTPPAPTGSQDSISELSLFVVVMNDLSELDRRINSGDVDAARIRAFCNTAIAVQRASPVSCPFCDSVPTTTEDIGAVNWLEFMSDGNLTVASVVICNACTDNHGRDKDKIAQAIAAWWPKQGVVIDNKKLKRLFFAQGHAAGHA